MFINSPFFLRLLTRAIRKIMALDPQLPQLLTPLDEKTILWTTPNKKITLFCKISEGECRFSSQNEIEPDLTITGYLYDLAQLWKNPESPINPAIKIQGDPQVLDALREVLKKIALDWQAPLSKYFGDPIAQQLGQLAKKSRNYVKEITESSFVGLGEYLQDDAKQCVSPITLQKFFSEVDTLRADVDRLEACLNRIESQ